MNLSWKLVATDASWLEVALAGGITETAQLEALVGLAGERSLRLDLAGIEQVNSCGVREWLHFVHRLAARGQPLDLVGCPPVFVRQLNMISNFRGHAAVRSVLLPYWCRACGNEDLVDHATPSAQPIHEHRACSRCGSPAEFDDLPDSYLSFLAEHAG